MNSSAQSQPCADAGPCPRSPQTATVLRWLDGYADFVQNVEIYRVDSVWTRRTGMSLPGLAACQRAGLIVSVRDDKIRQGGWRHDITPTGRAVLEAARAMGPASPQGNSGTDPKPQDLSARDQ